jgi:uncharacterized integral membrane protein (TIGR00697 family)
MQQTALVTDPVISAQRPHKYLGMFGMLWVTFLLIATFTAVKTFSFGGIVFSVAILSYPFTYIFADIFTEVYGYRVTRRIVWTGFFCVVLASVITSLYSIVPPHESFTYDDAFKLIFQASPIIAIATVAGFFGGELANSYVLAKLKLKTAGKAMWARLVGSTFAGQFVDNTIFFATAFLVAGVFTASELTALVLSSVTFCTVWEIVILPITYRVIGWIKRKEGLDTYDVGTNFNPFAFRQ